MRHFDKKGRGNGTKCRRRGLGPRNVFLVSFQAFSRLQRAHTTMSITQLTPHHHIEGALTEPSGEISGMYKWINFGRQCTDFSRKISRNNKSIFTTAEAQNVRGKKLKKIFK